MITKNKNGDQLLEIIETDEDGVLENHSPVTHALVVIKNKGKYVLLFNKYRNQWEIAGGMLEEGETPRACAERECLEEIGSTVICASWA